MTKFDDFKIKAASDEMSNGEIRFRMECEEDGSSYIRTVAGAAGGWQQSHFHKQSSETYIAQSGWICVACLMECEPIYFLIKPGELKTIHPNVIHNIYMPPNAVMHTIKHGDTVVSDRFTSADSSQLDAFTQSITEMEIFKICKNDNEIKTISDYYTQDYRHFDTLIWQAPTWSSAIFALTIAASGSLARDWVGFGQAFNASPRVLLSCFFFIVAIVLSLLWIVLLRFRMRQKLLKIKPPIPKKFWVMPGGQSCLQFVITIEIITLIGCGLTSIKQLGTYGIALLVLLVICLTIVSNFAISTTTLKPDNA